MASKSEPFDFRWPGTRDAGTRWFARRDTVQAGPDGQLPPAVNASTGVDADAASDFQPQRASSSGDADRTVPDGALPDGEDGPASDGAPSVLRDLRDPALDLSAQRRHVAIQVLVVEDNPAAAKLLGRVLRRAGYAVKVVGNYKDALRTASAWLPDLLVCDIGLPGRDGLELMRTMRRAHPTLKGIVVSGHATPKDRIASKEVGFAEHLAKPVSVPRLKEAIRRVLDEP
jgi:CheY-like chemotaxis protein